MSDNSTASILKGYVTEAEFAAANGIAQRTAARYRNQVDGLPYAMFGGKVYIPLEEAGVWLRNRIKRPNARRKAA